MADNYIGTYVPSQWPWYTTPTNVRRVVIPKLPEQPPEIIEYQCGECGMVFSGIMGYVCGSPRCPVFPRVTC